MGEHHLDKLRTQAMKALRLSHAGWWRFRYTEWKSFMWNFDGSLFSGPFSQLFVVLGQIGWRVEPPFLVDHDQCHLNLLGIDDSVLIPVLWDAWLQYVARQVLSRKTMQGLQVLDPHLLESASKNLTSLEQALMGALQSGPS